MAVSSRTGISRGRLWPLLAAIALIFSGCGGAEDPPAPSVTFNSDWLKMLPPAASQQQLSDARIHELLSDVGGRPDAGVNGLAFMVPRYSTGTPELFASEPTEVLARLRALYRQAESRESGAAITSVDAECSDSNSGDCSELALHFSCPKCTSSEQLPPMVVRLGPDGQYVPATIPGYAERIASDLGNDTILVVNTPQDPLAARTFERLGQSAVGFSSPVHHTCMKIPKGPRFCLPVP